jgi:hypothetical protein
MQIHSVPSAAGTRALVHPIRLRPFEPDLRAVAAGERVLRGAAGDGGWDRVRHALGRNVEDPPPTASVRAPARVGGDLTPLVTPAPLGLPTLPTLVTVGVVLSKVWHCPACLRSARA